MASLPDAADRLSAETTFDRNIVVLAGAGTGKTTLLVHRVVHALVREPFPVILPNLLALTFTNKAANEMKMRLRELLHHLLAESYGDGVAQRTGGLSLQALQDCYGLSIDVLRGRLETAWRDIDRAHIRTLHSFAGSVLRLYPLEAGVGPEFREDENSRFEEIFEQVWNRWLEQELGLQGMVHDQWEQMFQYMSLADIRALAYRLAKEDVPLSELDPPVDDCSQPPSVRQWIDDKADRIERLLEGYDRLKPRKIERTLRTTAQVLERIQRQGLSTVWQDFDDESWTIDADPGTIPADWDPADFREAKRLLQSVRQVRKVHHPLLHRLLILLAPCIEQVRQEYAEQGWIGFDGLLEKVRNLLRDVSVVREEMKSNFQTIVIDEFQDTDPLQYEILLYLMEELGQCARDWRDIRPVPGKLFIVGDPKQSIYAFRRADLEAFDQVVKKLVDHGALVCTLTANFRSTPNILDAVNAVFEHLMVPKANVQPPHVPLEPGRSTSQVSGSGVEIVVLHQPPGDPEWDAERATRAEAEWLGDWIQEQIQGHGSQKGPYGMAQTIRPGHIAVLFRKLTNTKWYLEALHRRDIPYVTDGERHFFERQEVIDFVNVLRVIDDPADGIALIGILRSSLGGLPDKEIMSLSGVGGLSMADPAVLTGWQSDYLHPVQNLYGQLWNLHRLKDRIPMSETLDRIFTDLPLVELAAASSHGEQAVLNLGKLRIVIGEMEKDPSVSFSVLIDRLMGFLRTRPQEAEAPLAEDSVDAVRVLTIHKAKGLEFPVVILPGLHQGAGGPEPVVKLNRDWVSGLYGCTFSRWCNSSHLPLWEKQRDQEEAEQRRILYVGMTRAKERLVLSGGWMPKGGSGTPFHLFRELFGEHFGDPDVPTVQAGSVSFDQTVIVPRSGKPSRDGTKTHVSTVREPAYPSLAGWEKRTFRWEEARKSKTRLTPSMMSAISAENGCSLERLESSPNGKRVGTLVHRFLEQCDFRQDREGFLRSLDEFCWVRTKRTSSQEKGTLCLKVRQVLESFPDSEIYRELHRGRIVGREVPVLLPWMKSQEDKGLWGSGIMEGIIDIVYEIDGDFWVGDYKSEILNEETLSSRVDRYRAQAHFYTQAVERGLGLAVKGCKLFFIRLGKAVEILTNRQ